jgi:hypothetical protein
VDDDDDDDDVDNSHHHDGQNLDSLSLTGVVACYQLIQPWHFVVHLSCVSPDGVIVAKAVTNINLLQFFCVGKYGNVQPSILYKLDAVPDCFCVTGFLMQCQLV